MVEIPNNDQSIFLKLFTTMIEYNLTLKRKILGVSLFNLQFVCDVCMRLIKKDAENNGL